MYCLSPVRLTLYHCRWKCWHDGGCGTYSKLCAVKHCTSVQYLLISNRHIIACMCICMCPSACSYILVTCRGGAHHYMTKLNACSPQVDSGLGQGSVIGVIPHDLMPREMSGAAIGELRPVDTMHQRKVTPNSPLWLHPVIPLRLISALSAFASRPAFSTESL